MKPYNTTQLNPDTSFERHVYHRDQFAHFLRWTHVLKLAKMNMKILDIGCGSGNLYEVFYRNRYAPTRYLGLDLRPQQVHLNQQRFPKAEFMIQDLTVPFDLGQDWDIITSFEVAEHVGKWKVPVFLDNIKRNCNPMTLVLLSTPCYDPKVGAAGNHTYDSGDGLGIQPQELTRDELRKLLEERFLILENYGTFASIKDYKDHLTLAELDLFQRLTRYYDSNLVSVIFAPLVPQYSRNNLWVCKLRS